MATHHPVPPGPRFAIPLVNQLAVGRDLIGFFSRLAAKYGDMSFVRVGPHRIHLINHPDLVQDVLVTRHHAYRKSWIIQMAKRVLGEGLLTSDGELHRRQRKLMQPAFHRQRVASYGMVMSEYAERTRERWQEGEDLDMAREMSRLTLSIAAKTLCDADIESEADEMGDALSETLNYYDRLLSPLRVVLDRLPLPSNRRFERASARMDATIYRMINKRRAAGLDRGDVMSMLLSAHDEDDGGVMTNRQVRDEVITLTLAGHETTANALTWTWYLLSQHPAVEAALHKEIDEVLEGRLPGVDDLPNLLYTRNVFKESMRLFPPAYMLSRQAVEDVPLGPYTVSEGESVLMSAFLLHRDARFYENPERFDPARWTPAMEEQLPRFAYFPFGGGPRTCIGEAFAWTEGMIVLAALAQRWSFQLLPGYPVALRPRITLRTRYGLRVRASARKVPVNC